MGGADGDGDCVGGDLRSASATYNGRRVNAARPSDHEAIVPGNKGAWEVG